MTNQITDSTLALWDPAVGRVYTFMLPYDGLDQPLRSAWGRETFDELVKAKRVSPASRLIPFGEALPLQEAADRARYCRGPQPCDEGRFAELLNCLPPEKWVRGGSTESFRLAEPLCGDLYTFCVRIGVQFWTLVERRDVPHDDLVRQCQGVAA